MKLQFGKEIVSAQSCDEMKYLIDRSLCDRATLRPLLGMTSFFMKNKLSLQDIQNC